VPDGSSAVIGRDPSVEIVASDDRISFRHARIEDDGNGWALEDLGSKNGITVNGVRSTRARLADGDWISFGGLLTEFDRITNLQMSELERQQRIRRQTTAQLQRAIAPGVEPRELLHRILKSVLEVAGAERGLVLLFGSDGRMTVEIAAGFGSADDLDSRFDGSLGAIERARRTGRPVVATDARSDAILGSRPSVAGRGISALACVPMCGDGRVFGVVYVDGRRAGGGFTELDLEILEALAGHAALVVAGCQIDQEIREIVSAPDGPPAAGRPFLEELVRRVSSAHSSRPSA